MRKNSTNSRKSEREERRKKEREERFSRFEAACAALCGQGYTQRDKTLPPRRAGTLGILTAAPFAIAAIVGGLFLPDLHFLLTGNLFADAALFLVLLLASIPAHEGLHALGYDGCITIEREIEGDQQAVDILAARDMLQGILAAL